MEQTIVTLSHCVDKAREQLCQERSLAAQRCGCAQGCARCRTGVGAASGALLRSLWALDHAQDLLERQRGAGAAQCVADFYSLTPYWSSAAIPAHELPSQ